MNRFWAAAGFAAMLGLGACANDMMMEPAQTATTSIGTVLVNDKGMTLYIFDRDAGGKSACNGPCATNWPPLMAAADAQAKGSWSVITRDDGMKQWAFKGKPVYAFARDAKPGDTTGDNFLNGAWHAAKP